VHIEIKVFSTLVIVIVDEVNRVGLLRRELVNFASLN
jgi:hypothetical protein